MTRVASLLAIAGFAIGQAKIEVATVKLNTSGEPRGMRTDPGRFIVTNTPLRILIRNAYRVPLYTITGGPGWMDSVRYDIEAKVEGEFNGEAALPLLQALLEDRFQLKVHRETKEGPVYFLTVAKGGAKLPVSNCVARPPGEKICGTVSSSKTEMNLLGVKIDDPNSTTVPGFTFYLSSVLERVVIDKTGLTERYDIHLDYAGDSVPADVAINGPSIFTAMQEQLGLRLESGKGPVPLFVIDHIEKPSEN
jgi:uncharacterized protein (TIGR03435 family)